jgi:hypothetical protein
MKWFVLVALIISCAVDIPGADALPVVNVYANQSIIREGTHDSGIFTIVKNTFEPLVVRCEFGGTAKLNADYTSYAVTNTEFNVWLFHSFTNAANITVDPVKDAEVEPDESIVLRLLPDPSYQIGEASLAAIRIQSIPLPTVTLNLNSQVSDELLPGKPFTFTGRVSGNVTSVWVYIDDSLQTLKWTASSYGAFFSVTWTNPPLGRHVITAKAQGIYGMSTNDTRTVHVLDALATPGAIGRTLEGVTIISGGASIVDSSGRAGVFVEFAIPTAATNYDALLSFDPWVPHQIFAYDGDGVIDTNDLTANLEFVGTVGRWATLRTQVEIGALVRRYAGRHLGLKLRVDPAYVSDQYLNGTEVAYFERMRVAMFARDSDLPGHILWTNVSGNAHFNDEPMRIDLETFDLDSRIKAVEVRATSFTNAPRLLRQEVDLAPGTNHLTLWWTNNSPGIKTFSIRMESEHEVVTNIVGNITFYPTREGSPVHRWLGLDGEGSSFYVVDAAGRAWVWGRNQNGQLGLGFTNASVTRPVSLAAPAGKKWRHFTYNSKTAVGVTDDGATYVVGSMALFEMMTNALTPRSFVSAPPDFIRRAALTETGVWKINGWGALELIGAIPAAGMAPQIDGKVKDIDAGGNTLLALRMDGQVEPLVPTNNGAVLPWTVISRSKVHSLAIDSDGQMFGWGENAAGQLPVAGTQYSDVPLKANPPPGGGRWTNVCAGFYVSLAVANGRLYSWGREGWTGSSSYAPCEPRPVDLPEDEIGWLDMSAGSAAALALSARGNLYMWGRDEKPRKVEGLPPLLDANATASYVAFDSSSLRALDGLTASLISGTSAAMTVQFSTDLVNWQTVTNLVNAVGKTSVSVPAASGGNLFMRVRSESSL